MAGIPKYDQKFIKNSPEGPGYLGKALALAGIPKYDQKFRKKSPDRGGHIGKSSEKQLELSLKFLGVKYSVSNHLVYFDPPSLQLSYIITLTKTLYLSLHHLWHVLIIVESILVSIKRMTEYVTEF